MDAVALAAAKVYAKRNFVGQAVPPSGDTTGVADSAAFNAAFTKSNRVHGIPGSTYYFGPAVYQPSHSVLDMTGCTINQPTGTFNNILRNKAVDPTRTVTDGQGISGGQYMVSATANFVSGDVGSSAGLTGGGAGGATWYGTIGAVSSPTTATAWTATTGLSVGVVRRPTTSNGKLYWTSTAGTTAASEPTWPTTTGGTVTDGTAVWTCLGVVTAATITTRSISSTASTQVACACNTTITGAALSVFATRDTDITIQGGSWNFCDQTSAPQPSSQLTNFPTCWRRVDGLRIRDLVITQAGAAGQGGRFVLSAADVTDYHFDRITFNGTAGDGVHVDGPAFFGTINDITGTTGDDMVVLAPEDSSANGVTSGHYMRDTEGNVHGFAVKNITGYYTWNCFKLYDLGTQQGKFSFSHGHVEGIRGTAKNGVVVLIGTSTSLLVMDDVRFSHITASTQGSIPVVQSIYSAKVSSHIFEDVVWTSTAVASNGIVRINDPRGLVKVTNLRMATNPAGSNIGLNIIGSIGAPSGAGFGSQISVVGAFCAPGGQLVAATFSLFVYSGTGGILPFVHIDDAYIAPSSSGYLVQLSSAVGIADLDISNVKFSGTALISAPSSTSAVTARLSNVSVAATNLAAVSAPLTLEMVNVDVTTTGAVVAATGANATPVRIAAANYKQSGAGTGVSRDGTQAISVDGRKFSVDQTLLTPSDGDEIFNSNATPLNGTGVAIYNTAAAKWKNVYSGTTS